MCPLPMAGLGALPEQELYIDDIGCGWCLILRSTSSIMPIQPQPWVFTTDTGDIGHRWDTCWLPESWGMLALLCR